MLEYELAAFQKGFILVAGVDEAGRGPLAGPVVAAAVLFPKELLERFFVNPEFPENKYLAEINDSKKLTPKKREKLFSVLQQDVRVAKGIGVVDEKVIDKINIYQATIQAMKQALLQLQPPPQHVLVDGNPLPALGFPHQGIVKGDAKSVSIAAASIIAKVLRDKIMMEYDEKYPQYNFRAHKGYGTADHLERIKRHGPSPVHRLSFAPIRKELDLFLSSEGS